MKELNLNCLQCKKNFILKDNKMRKYCGTCRSKNSRTKFSKMRNLQENKKIFTLKLQEKEKIKLLPKINSKFFPIVQNSDNNLDLRKNKLKC